ncbi:MAG: toll/interleukin-1 receptor domain-containing protein [Sedimentisphaerales bacterium]|nr:toll/interleukin-1 receptor domain-containing protein [Sedimentisphaerales bacterium]
MKTASAYKALWDGDKQFLSAIAIEVATLVAVPENMDYFQKQLTEFTDKWRAYKTAYEADRKSRWQPSMGRPSNPLGTIWPSIYGSGWSDGAENFLHPEGGGIRIYNFCRDVKFVLGAYALLAVVQDNVLPHCPPIVKGILPKKLCQEIWRNLVTGIDVEGQTFSGGDEVSQQPRSVIRRDKIAGFLIDVRADIGQNATALSEIEKLYFNKFSPTHRELWERTKKNDDEKKSESAKGAGTLEEQELEETQKYLNDLESRLASRQFNVDTFQTRWAELDSITSRLVKLNPKNNVLWPLISKAYWLQGIIRNAIEPFPVRPEFKETFIDVANTVDALFHDKNYKTKLDEYGRKFHDMGAGWQLILILQREKLIERDYWLLIIVHDWLLRDCEPIDQNRTLMRLGNLGFLADLLLIDKDKDGVGIIKRALNHVQQHLREQPAKERVQADSTSTRQNAKEVKLQPKELSKDAIRNQVFICYSHKDERWLNDLQIHLKPHVRNGLTAWSDKQIAPGSKCLPEIETALASAKVAVLLVTPYFLDSDFIHEKELGPLLKKAEKGKVRIIWIPVRACAYKETPLKDYQAAGNPDNPLANMKAERDKVWVKICEEIKEAVLEK